MRDRRISETYLSSCDTTTFFILGFLLSLDLGTAGDDNDENAAVCVLLKRSYTAKGFSGEGTVGDLGDLVGEEWWAEALPAGLELMLFMGIGVEVEVVVGLLVGCSITEQGALPNVCFFLCNNSMETSFIAGDYKINNRNKGKNKIEVEISFDDGVDVMTGLS